MMKKFGMILAAVLFCAALLPVMSYAGTFRVTIEQTDSVTGSGGIEEIIQSFINFIESNHSSGGTVIVRGSRTNADSTLTLNIPENVAVVWQADYSGNVRNSGRPLIQIDGTGGTFEAASGGVIRAIGGDAIRAYSAEIMVTGGTVETTLLANEWFSAIYIENDGAVTVTEGRVSAAASGDRARANAIVINSGRGTAAVTGGAVSVTANGHGGFANAISVFGDGAVTVTGGTVSAAAERGRAAAIILEDGVGAFLRGTCTGWFYIEPSQGTGMIVEADTLSIPPASHGTNDRLHIMDGADNGTVEWDTSGAKPVIVFKLADGRTESLDWGHETSGGGGGGGCDSGAAGASLLAMMLLMPRLRNLRRRHNADPHGQVFNVRG